MCRIKVCHFSPWEFSVHILEQWLSVQEDWKMKQGMELLSQLSKNPDLSSVRRYLQEENLLSIKQVLMPQCPAQKEHNSLWLVLMWTQFYWQKMRHRSLLRTPDNSCNGSQIPPCLITGMELREPLVTTWAALPASLLFQPCLLVQAEPAHIVRQGGILPSYSGVLEAAQICGEKTVK